MERSNVIAALGPTNTGKTHRATARLLEHETGMMGLPLRLLAREVYDKVRARVGEHAVALITGEEKLVPRRACYFICTVEAMPLDREVDFLAVDEIQLAAHPERGHVFTHRLLHARGRLETWFMGSETMRPLIEQLVPTAQLRRFPRLSSLHAESSYTLGSLPRRSAVVAFSASKVYEIAEKLRARKGGAAVVLGALSPRARNAQVELYENGEVDYLVATDAIGMGLNLDIDRVAFSETRKFDGHELRDLELAELGQIAGRAGRHQRDGAFGTFERAPLSYPVTRALVEHRFPTVRHLVYRNHDLDFSSAQALVGSLEQSPRHAALRLVQHPEDTETLKKVLRLSEVQRRIENAEGLQTLWEICQIPDYRKLLVDEHAHLARDLFLELVDHGHVREGFIRQRMERLRTHSGDIDAILDRIKAVRTWTYVTHQKGWVLDALPLQRRAAELEDLLSDDLNSALVERFVERRKRSPLRGTAVLPPSGKVDFRTSLQALYAELQPPQAPHFIDQLLAAPFEQIDASAEGDVLFQGRRIGRLRPGPQPTRPRVASELEGGSRLQQHLDTWRSDYIDRCLGSFLAKNEDGKSSAIRGLLYQLRQNYGCIQTRDVSALLPALTDKDRVQLLGQGVIVGSIATFVRSQIRPAALQRRIAAVRFSDERWPAVLSRSDLRGTLWEEPERAGNPSMPAAGLPTQLWLRVGYVKLAQSAVRADIVEKIIRRARDQKMAEVARLVATMSSMKRRAAAAAARSLTHTGALAGS